MSLSCGFDVVEAFSYIGYIRVHGIECGFDEILFARLIICPGQFCPIAEIGVCAGHDQTAGTALGAGFGVIKRESATGDVAAQQQFRAE